MLRISPTVASMDVSSLISRRSASAGSSPVETQPEMTPPRMAVPECMSQEENPAIRAEQDSRNPNGDSRGIGPTLYRRGKPFKGAQDPVDARMLG